MTRRAKFILSGLLVVAVGIAAFGNLRRIGGSTAATCSTHPVWATTGFKGFIVRDGAHWYVVNKKHSQVGLLDGRPTIFAGSLFLVSDDDLYTPYTPSDAEPLGEWQAKLVLTPSSASFTTFWSAKHVKISY